MHRTGKPAIAQVFFFLHLMQNVTVINCGDTVYPLRTEIMLDKLKENNTPFQNKRKNKPRKTRQTNQKQNSQHSKHWKKKKCKKLIPNTLLGRFTG